MCYVWLNKKENDKALDDINKIEALGAKIDPSLLDKLKKDSRK